MPATLELQATRCAICETRGNADELYPAAFDAAALNPETFSARRLPDRVHYRMVRCRTCGLVRSDPVADSALLADLYRNAGFTYGEETGNLKKTYGACLERAKRHAPGAEALLEIGCGNGFLLEEALARGYRTVSGVEPTVSAVEKAAPEIRSCIACDIMRPGLFDPESFDTVCMFQVLDHLPDPVAVLAECRRVLKPGGVILAVNHNVRAASARILGERSPIVDVEHTYLYDPRTMRRLFARCGFTPCESGAVWNRYSLLYLARLVPFPAGIKTGMLRLLKGAGAGGVSFSVPIGNLYLVARKSEVPA